MIRKRQHLTWRRGAGVIAAAGMVALIAAAPAGAQSLRERRAQEAEERALADQAAYTQQLCGVSFSTEIDWASFSRWPENADVSRACDRGLSEIETRCRRGDTPTLTRFICAGDGSGLRMGRGAARYGASPR